MLRLHAFFHLNLMFSSIEEESRPEVVENCYWGILNLAERLGRPIGIEASGYTLEEIARIDPTWMAHCRRLINRGLIEPIGSGYAQTIGPLMPAALTAWNLKLGNEVYERLFGRHPRIALINEQAYSAGLVPLYAETGYEALMMDWDMCAHAHPDWNDEWRYHVQIAQGQGADLPVLWTNTVAFQKLQRLAHGDIDLDDYLDYILARRGGGRTLAIYSNDAEVFDYRPGRYSAEPAQSQASEWDAVETALSHLLESDGVEWISTSQAIEEQAGPNALNRLKLESAAFPVPVKKQMKYNISRWAVTGRADFEINRRCRELVMRLTGAECTDKTLWRRLTWLASSDFRTHITEKRFAKMLAELGRLEHDTSYLTRPSMDRTKRPAPSPIRHEETPRLLQIESDGLSLTLNKRKGLAIEALHFHGHERALIGTIRHGDYDDVVHAFDWFSGTLISEFVGQPKWTDLFSVEPQVETNPGTRNLTIRSPLPSDPEQFDKTIEVSACEPKITVRYRLPSNHTTVGTIRIGNITLLPSSIDPRTLYFETHNGGREPERFPLFGETIDHGAPISFLVSAASGVGMTQGWIKIGDAQSGIHIAATEDSNAFLGLVTHRMVKGKVFCRVSLSASELDETRKPWRDSPSTLNLGYTLSPA